MPVISAVGHEIDFTVADLAADLRAPTPSAAAELVAPDSGEIARQLNGVSLRMEMCIRDSYKATLWAGAFFCDMLGVSSVRDTLKSIGNCLTIAVALLFTYALLVIITTVIVMMGVG